MSYVVHEKLAVVRYLWRDLKSLKLDWQRRRLAFPALSPDPKDPKS